tara:strand:- start:10 stop:972 length:963 start_codon:yes stop_codon:yes gene_type:complete
MIVYSITNKINNKKYFCVTIFNDLKRPKYYHRAKSKSYRRRMKLNPNLRVSIPPFHKSFNKYGEKNFKYKIEKKFKNIHQAYNYKEKLIDTYKTMNPKYGYNCTTGGYKSFKNNVETIKRMKVSHLGKKMPKSFVKMMKERVGELHPHYGIKRSKEARENIRQGHLNSDYVITEEHKRKTSKTMKKRWQEPKVIEKMAKRKLRDISGKNNPMYGVGRKGKDNPMYGRVGELNPNYGKIIPQWQKDIISKKNKEHAKKRREKFLKKIIGRTEKECYKCNQIKKLDLFYKSKSHLDGYAGMCKSCEKTRKREIKIKRSKKNG